MRSVVFLFFLIGSISRVAGQSFEVQELVLDIQKLAQEKQLLSDLYKGYAIVANGYGAIRDLSKGSFDLHKAFLDGLLTVSPAVKKYQRVADIIRLQSQLLASYKSFWEKFRKDPHFTPDELATIGGVYSGLFDQSIRLLTTLTMLLTDGQLRADDGQRIRQIDGLYDGMAEKWVFLQSFNNGTALLSLQRAAGTEEVGQLRRWYGITN